MEPIQTECLDDFVRFVAGWERAEEMAQNVKTVLNMFQSMMLRYWQTWWRKICTIKAISSFQQGFIHLVREAGLLGVCTFFA